MPENVNERQDEEIEGLLSQGLREIPTPSASAGFDDRVLRAVRRPRRWWWIDRLGAFSSSPIGSRIPALAGLTTAGISLAVLLAPSTSWILRVHSGLPNNSNLSIARTMRDLGVREAPLASVYEDPNEPVRVANLRGPNDFQLQLAASVYQYRFRQSAEQPDSRDNTSDHAIKSVGGPSTGDAVRALELRFPTTASLFANALRYDTQGRIRLNRPDAEKALLPPPTKNDSNAAKLANGSTNQQERPPVSPAALDLFLRDCRRGETLEPDNGYFPMLRAGALFAARRDSDALAALRRAAGLTRWDPHYRDEAEGQWRLNQLLYGDGSAVQRLAVQSSIVFPELSFLQTTARVATAQAALAERAGRWRDGLRIRSDVARCGALMRVEAPSLIGSMVGMNITNISTSAPGGITSVNPPTQHTKRPLRVERYALYLRAMGHAKEAGWIETETDLGESLRTSIQGQLNRLPTGEHGMRTLSLHWLGGLLLYGNAFWLTAFGLLGAFYVRRWKARRAAGWVREDAFVVVMGGACILLACSIVAWSQGQLTVTLAWVYASLGVLSIASQPLTENVSVVRIVAACLLVVAPAVLGFAAFIAAAIRRRPVLLDMARALRAIGLPLAALLMVGYAVSATYTARLESEMHSALRSMMVHEGRYTSSFSNMPWPGFNR
jgi:hypothetical protein